MQLEDIIDDTDPLAEWDDENLDGPTGAIECPCGGVAVLLGVLGRLAHYRCQHCAAGLCVDISE